MELLNDNKTIELHVEILTEVVKFCCLLLAPSHPSKECGVRVGTEDLRRGSLFFNLLAIQNLVRSFGLLDIFVTCHVIRKLTTLVLCLDWKDYVKPIHVFMNGWSGFLNFEVWSARHLISHRLRTGKFCFWDHSTAFCLINNYKIIYIK